MKIYPPITTALDKTTGIRSKVPYGGSVGARPAHDQMESATVGSYMVKPSQHARSSLWHSNVCSEENGDEVSTPA